VGRSEKHPSDTILDAARDLVLAGGARAATIDRVVATSGAPKGSIYYRFGTLDDLLAAMWLRAVRRSQAAFLQALEADDPVEAAVAAAMSLYIFARDHPRDAALLASMRREDLIHSVRDDGLRRELDEINKSLERSLVALTRRLTGQVSRSALDHTICAVVDLPQGALRRHLTAGSTPPRTLRTQLEAAVRAALGAPTLS
jgi:AcrR family transcriptional regulator